MLNDRPDEAVGARVGVQPAPGKPPKNFGQYYVSLYFGGGRGIDPNPQRSDEMMSLVAVLTFKMNYAPRDRQSKEMTKSQTGAAALYKLADTVRDAVHGNWTLINTVNALIPGTAAYLSANGGDPADATVNGFTETLVTESFPSERPAPADWTDGDGKDVWTMELRFKDARRIRGIY